MSNIVKDLILNEDIEQDPEAYSSELGDYEREKILNDKIYQLNQDPTIAIIGKNITTEDELLRLYNKYSLLPKKFKRLSNQYSIQLFGYNVPNMFAMMRDKLIDNDNIFIDGDNVMESSEDMRSVSNLINEAVLNNDESLLDSINTDNLSVQEKAIIDYDFSEAKKEIQENKYYDFSDYSIVPWFTLDEGYAKLEHFEDPDYSKKVIEAMRNYKYNCTLENCNKVLDLGWNPSVELTKSAIEYAKQRQIEYLKEHSSIIYDLTKTDISAITESTKEMRDYYKKLNIYPVYIVLSWTNTTFGKLIRFVKNSKYTHAGMSLDSDLREIVTFKYDSVSNGFEIENLKGYINTYRDCQIEVLCLFVNKKILSNLRDSIEYYKKSRDVTKYGFKNLFNILLNRKKEFTAFDTEMVCSQFVDHILKLCDIDVTGKANNLVIPQDYATIASQNPKVYKIFEGYGKDYIDVNAEKILKDLIEKNGYKIRYKEEAYNLDESIEIPLELAIYTIENE